MVTREGMTVDTVVVVTIGSVATGTEGIALQRQMLKASAQRALRGCMIVPMAPSRAMNNRVEGQKYKTADNRGKHLVCEERARDHLL